MRMVLVEAEGTFSVKHIVWYAGHCYSPLVFAKNKTLQKL